MPDAGLLDIADLCQKVKVGRKDVAVYGLSAQGIVMLMQRYPEAQLMLTGKADEIAPERLLQLIPAAIPTVIAAGMGFPGDEQQEAAAGKLSIETQVDLLHAIIKMTMPSGFGPFVEKLEAMGIKVNKAAMKVPDIKSPKASKNSKAPEAIQTSGATHRAA